VPPLQIRQNSNNPFEEHLTKENTMGLSFWMKYIYSLLTEKKRSPLNEYYLKTKSVVDDIQIDNNRGGKKKCAIFVMVQNEKIFLPIWLKYYTKYFDGDDIFVFDHRTTDGSIEDCAGSYKFRTIKLDYPYSFDHKWFQFFEEITHAKLLQFYEYVIFTDIDEILFADPEKYSGLDDYLSRLKENKVRCLGYELIHMKDKEQTFDLDKPVLAQRHYWYRSIWYDKTLISNIPLQWRIGNHKIFGKKAPQDKYLLLIHLHKLDFDMCWNKSVERSKLPWTDFDLKSKRGWQNRITDIEEFKEYFYNWPKNIKITEIPEELRQTGLF